MYLLNSGYKLTDNKRNCLILHHVKMESNRFGLDSSYQWLSMPSTKSIILLKWNDWL